MMILPLLLTFASVTNAAIKPDPPAVFCATALRAAYVRGYELDEGRVELRLDGDEVDLFVAELGGRRDQIKRAVGAPAYYRGTLVNLLASGGVTGTLALSLPFLPTTSFYAASATLLTLALTEFPTYPLRWLAARDYAYADLLKQYVSFRSSGKTEFSWRRRFTITPAFLERLTDGAGAPDVADEIRRQLGTPFQLRRTSRESRTLSVSIFADKTPSMLVVIGADEPGSVAAGR